MSLQLLISGISLGSVYALIAVGFAIVFSVLKFSNFAHGGMISACAYIGYYFQRSFPSTPPIYVTILFSALCGVALSFLVDFIAYRRLRAKQAPNIYYFLASITVSIAIVQILSVFYGNNLYAYPAIFESTTFFIGSIRFSTIDTLILLVSLAMLAVLIYLIDKTRVGLAIRAVAINAQTSKLMG
ncbi:MAG TPA: branched-chain amino acid ABC transporter permease, partial [Clostridia bacterium]|nr:branched-chain amino acid ABC transporter permease [Clostridia bacterium]